MVKNLPARAGGVRQLALLLLLVLGAVLLLAGCLDDEDEGEKALLFANEYRAEDSWLVYWYVCGTDLESEMGAASSDLEELQQVQLPENVKVLIQTGGTEKWQNDKVKGGVIGRYLYDKDGLA